MIPSERRAGTSGSASRLVLRRAITEAARREGGEGGTEGGEGGRPGHKEGELRIGLAHWPHVPIGAARPIAPIKAHTHRRVAMPRQRRITFSKARVIRRVFSRECVLYNIL